MRWRKITKVDKEEEGGVGKSSNKEEHSYDLEGHVSTTSCLQKRTPRIHTGTHQFWVANQRVQKQQSYISPGLFFSVRVDGL
mmetsp:Transcript_29759/g.30269  ORF Transcript_29759/g.30269 Transcript_29759/m.30269 type:complete len:82 (-) Transcript_29759:115-360(-)